MFDRRELLRRGLALGLAPALLPLAAGARAAEAEPPQVRRRVSLGKTGLELPDIGFGSSSLSGDEALVRHALARGISYFDTAESYQGGSSEETLGRALAGRRNEVLIASKQSAGASTKRAELFETLEGSLRRLRTDRIDVYFNHAVNGPARLQNDEWSEFASRAKQQGKIRFTGMSGHGGRLVECLELAVERKLVDVVLVAFNFGQDAAFYEKFTGSFDFVARQPELPRVLRKARAAGVGVVAMKTLRGARLNDMRPYEGAGATFAQAAFRWIFAAGLADALIVTMNSPAQVDEYLGASGWTAPHPADAALLRRYARRTERTQCRYGCGDCTGACPAGVSIPDVLRARMYAVDYEEPSLARAALAEAGGAAACLTCNGTPCATACPHGVAIPELTSGIARQATATHHGA
jgi:predicted aldo/keto reductase-like oxidoreductase